MGLLTSGDLGIKDAFAKLTFPDYVYEKSIVSPYYQINCHHRRMSVGGTSGPGRTEYSR